MTKDQKRMFLVIDVKLASAKRVSVHTAVATSGPLNFLVLGADFGTGWGPVERVVEDVRQDVLKEAWVRLNPPRRRLHVHDNVLRVPVPGTFGRMQFVVAECDG